MSITLVDITELPSGTATLANPIMFGIGELLHTTTLEDIKTLMFTGVITEIPPNKIKIVNFFPHATFDEEWEVNQLNAVGNAINYSLTTYYGGVITTVAGERIVFRLILRDPNLLRPNVSRYYYSEVSGDLTFTGITNALNDIVPNGFVRNEPENLIQLGNIGVQSIVSGFNTSIDAPFNMNSDTFITAIQDGDLNIWKWIGDDGSFGGGSTQAVLGDFLLIEQAPLTPLNFLPVKKIESTPHTITNDDLNRPLWFTSNNQVVNVPSVLLGVNTNILLFNFEAYFSGTGTHTVNHPQGGVDTFSQGDYIKALRYDNSGATLWTVKKWDNDSVDSVNGQTGVVVVNEEDIQGTVITANVTGTYNIDFNAASVFILTMTGNTDFQLINDPAAGFGKIVTLWLTGNFTPTFTFMLGSLISQRGDDYDGLVLNKCTIDYSAADLIDLVIENTEAS